MPSVEKFKESLADFRVEEAITAEINAGTDFLSSRSPKKAKAAYFQHAIEVMDRTLSPERVQEILEWNACCKGGARLKASKAFAKVNAGLSLEEKLQKITEVPNMGTPVLNADGTITVHAVSYSDGEKFLCACPNFNGVKRESPVSRNYCFCCAGHFKFHYEILLGVTLQTVEICSSPLDTDGKEPCVLRFAIV